MNKCVKLPKRGRAHGTKPVVDGLTGSQNNKGAHYESSNSGWRLGTRISEESVYKPKPMIEIGNMPILWHIMKEYSYYGFHDFVICAGYKQHMIKEWFADYFLHTSDITFDFTRGQNEMIVHNHHTEPWKAPLWTPASTR